MKNLTVNEWLQTHVNDFCSQTSEKEVSLETLIDLLYDLDEDKANAVLMTHSLDEILRPGPVPVEL